MRFFILFAVAVAHLVAVISGSPVNDVAKLRNVVFGQFGDSPIRIETEIRASKRGLWPWSGKEGCNRVPPANGSLVCGDKNVIPGLCIPMCLEGFDFARRPGKFYMCYTYHTRSGEYGKFWQAMDSISDLRGYGIWPDCIATVKNPMERRLMSDNHYFPSNLSPSATKALLKVKAVKEFKASSPLVPIYNCNADPKCIPRNFDVFM